MSGMKSRRVGDGLINEISDDVIDGYVTVIRDHLDEMMTADPVMGESFADGEIVVVNHASGLDASGSRTDLYSIELNHRRMTVHCNDVVVGDDGVVVGCDAAFVTIPGVGVRWL